MTVMTWRDVSLSVCPTIVAMQSSLNYKPAWHRVAAFGHLYSAPNLT